VNNRRDNLLDNYLAAVLLAFRSAGILEVLVEVATSVDLNGEENCHVAKATVLIGEVRLSVVDAFL
jgi:hypothetical protein